MKTPTKRRASRAPKLDPKVFVKAAELIADSVESYACCALDTAEDSSDGPHCIYFEDVLRPRHLTECRDGDPLSLNTSAYVAWYGPTWIDVNRHARVIGLLLCAELVKDGFEPSPYKRC